MDSVYDFVLVYESFSLLLIWEFCLLPFLGCYRILIFLLEASLSYLFWSLISYAVVIFFDGFALEYRFPLLLCFGLDTDRRCMRLNCGMFPSGGPPPPTLPIISCCSTVEPVFWLPVLMSMFYSCWYVPERMAWLWCIIWRLVLSDASSSLLATWWYESPSFINVF